jgi:hypothetical protein
MKMNFKRFVTIKEAAKLVPVAEKTFRNWRSQGLYPNLFSKIGGKVLVDLLELENILQN